jgi:hypothetical protein
MSKIKPDNKSCFFSFVNQYKKKAIFMINRTGTKRLKIARIGVFFGEIYGNA